MQSSRTLIGDLYSLMILPGYSARILPQNSLRHSCYCWQWAPRHSWLGFVIDPAPHCPACKGQAYLGPSPLGHQAKRTWPPSVRDRACPLQSLSFSLMARERSSTTFWQAESRDPDLWQDVAAPTSLCPTHSIFTVVTWHGASDLSASD